MARGLWVSRNTRYIYIYIYIHMHINIYMYIYIDRRVRLKSAQLNRDLIVAGASGTLGIPDIYTYTYIYIHIHIHIHIYIYIYRS